MGLLSLAKSPVASEDRLLVSENAASNLLSLAAQIALEVRTHHRTHYSVLYTSRKICGICGKRICSVWWNNCHISLVSCGIVMVLEGFKHLGLVLNGGTCSLDRCSV